MTLALLGYLDSKNYDRLKGKLHNHVAVHALRLYKIDPPLFRKQFEIATESEFCHLDKVYKTRKTIKRLRDATVVWEGCVLDKTGTRTFDVYPDFTQSAEKYATVCCILHWHLHIGQAEFRLRFEDVEKTFGCYISSKVRRIFESEYLPLLQVQAGIRKKT